MKKMRQQQKGPIFVNFVKSGSSAKRTDTGGGILATADDWELRADHGTRLKFPEEVTSTNLRPDIVLLSRRTKQLAIVELTVPYGKQEWRKPTSES